MPIEPIKIPQNVHIEDRIVGPLTLKQVIITAIGCGFSYALYSLLLKTYGAVPLPVTILAWVPGALSFVFAFVRINDLSLMRLVLLFVERMNKPAVRVWAPRRGLVINIRTFTTPEQDAKKDAEPHAGKSIDQIDELSRILDQSMPKKQQKNDDAEDALEESDELGPPPAVDRSRVSANQTPSSTVDTIIAPKTGSISIFRDISPKVS